MPTEMFLPSDISLQHKIDYADQVFVLAGSGVRWLWIKVEDISLLVYAHCTSLSFTTSQVRITVLIVMLQALQQHFSTLRHRLLACELEDFGMTKDADWSNHSPEVTYVHSDMMTQTQTLILTLQSCCAFHNVFPTHAKRNNRSPEPTLAQSNLVT